MSFSLSQCDRTERDASVKLSENLYISEIYAAAAADVSIYVGKKRIIIMMTTREALSLAMCSRLPHHHQKKKQRRAEHSLLSEKIKTLESEIFIFINYQFLLFCHHKF